MKMKKLIELWNLILWMFKLFKIVGFVLCWCNNVIGNVKVYFWRNVFMGFIILEIFGEE